MRRAKREAFFFLVFQGKKSLFITCHARRVGYPFLFSLYVCVFLCMFVSVNIVIGHLSRPRSTHTAPMPVPMGSVLAHILTKPSRAGFAVIRLELIEPGAKTCVYQAKACAPTDQPVRKFKDGLGINMTMKTFFTLHITSCEEHGIM